MNMQNNLDVDQPLQTIISKTSFRDDSYLPHKRLKSQDGKMRLPHIDKNNK